MVKCIIVDDEMHAIDGLKRYIRELPKLEIVKSYTDPLVALQEIPQLAQLDILFLDVDMPTISGIDLARELRSKTKKLVFTTSHSKYGFDAFEVGADGYLLKPYSLSKFLILMNRLFPQVTMEKRADRYEEFFFVKEKGLGKIIRVFFSDVIALESVANYVRIYARTGETLTYGSMIEIGKIFLDRSNFTKIHRSFIVNMSYIHG
ncbi:MAG: response regulator transcription factor, partial [Sphingobacteriales bacterium]